MKILFYTSNSGPVYYDVQGAENSKTIVLTHGIGLNSNMFQAQVDALKDDFKVITWDMPGHGRSHALDGVLKVDQMSGIIMGILDELGIEKAVVGGQSLGSWVAQHTAILYPNRIIGVVNISGTPIEKQLSKVLIHGFKVWLKMSHLFPAKKMFKWTADSKAITQNAKTFAYQSMCQIGKKQFLWMVEGMLNAEAIVVPHGVKQPMLIAHGDHEMPKFVEKECKEWFASIDNATYYLIPDAGHNGNQDNPIAFNQALIAFLKSI